MLPSPQDRALMTLCRLSNQGSVKGGAGHLWNHILGLNLVRIRHIMHSLAGTWAGWDGLAQIVWLAGIWWVGSRLAGIWASWGLGWLGFGLGGTQACWDLGWLGPWLAGTWAGWDL